MSTGGEHTSQGPQLRVGNISGAPHLRAGGAAALWRRATRDTVDVWHAGNLGLRAGHARMEREWRPRWQNCKIARYCKRGEAKRRVMQRGPAQV